ncbi:MAG: hypothetical protein ACON4J_04140 [Parvibaculales bacterium]
MQKFYNIGNLPDDYSEPEARYRVLFLADDEHPSQVVRQHIDAISSTSFHELTVVNCRFEPLIDIFNKGGLKQYDAILIHYSIHALAYIKQDWLNFIASFPGAVLAIHEDEYQDVDTFTTQFSRLGVQHLVSCLSSVDLLKQVYLNRVSDDCAFYHSLPGYVFNEFDQPLPPPLKERDMDIVYRGRELPFQLGKFAQLKKNIGEKMLAVAEEKALRTDISSKENDRIYGADWHTFLQSSKAVLGTEGGASIFDFDGSLKQRIQEFVSQENDPTFEKAYDSFLKKFENNVVYKTITPKIFEYVASKTVMILHPGEYCGYIHPNEHYLSLAEDFSNIDDVLAKLANLDEMQEMVDRTYEHIKHNDQLRFKFYVQQLDKIIGQGCRKNPIGSFFKAKNKVNLDIRYDIFQNNLISNAAVTLEDTVDGAPNFYNAVNGLKSETSGLHQKVSNLSTSVHHLTTDNSEHTKLISKLRNENEQLCIQLHTLSEMVEKLYLIEQRRSSQSLRGVFNYLRSKLPFVQ